MTLEVVMPTARRVTSGTSPHAVGLCLILPDTFDRQVGQSITGAKRQGGGVPQATAMVRVHMFLVNALPNRTLMDGMVNHSTCDQKHY
jgi:hypothetical protein